MRSADRVIVLFLREGGCRIVRWGEGCSRWDKVRELIDNQRLYGGPNDIVRAQAGVLDDVDDPAVRAFLLAAGEVVPVSGRSEP